MKYLPSRCCLVGLMRATDVFVGKHVERFRITEENEKVMNGGGEPADGTPLLLGINKASLSTDSFISASFQESTRVHRGQHRRPSGPLRGLKERVGRIAV